MGRVVLVPVVLLIAVATCWGGGPGGQGQNAPGELTDMSLEALMELKVSSAARKEQRVADSAAAVFVITQEDIRRSGVTSIADALRMVPGLDVARIDSNKWAISSRGFNSRFAGEMLVLFDGRVVYTPLFSGVFWDRQDTVLEDIDRIEVIRGPGAALWGANAVNGVINIITKPADETPGGLIAAGGGTGERAFGSVRYGVALGSHSDLRLYAKYLERDHFKDSNGTDGADSWHMVRGGFRLDSSPSGQDTLTVQGDVYDGRLGETYINMLPDSGTRNTVTPVSGGSILARWKRSFSERSDMSLQLYYDRSEQDLNVIGEKRDTLDLDYQNRFPLGSDHEITWGLGYRFTHDTIANSSYVSITPDSQDNRLYSAFVQDDITLVADRLHLVLGSKFEHNDYTGFEVQPTARLLWTPTRRNSVWVAVSRAVRTPSRGEAGFTLYASTPASQQAPPVFFKFNGSNRLAADELMAYELGYRAEFAEGYSFDAAAFYNVYHRLDVLSQGQPFFETSPDPPHVAIPGYLNNSGSAQTCGFELAADAQPLPWWRLRTAYTFLQFVEEHAAPDAIPWDPKGESPRHQLSVRSSLDLPRDVELDLWLRYADQLPNLAVGSYVTLDVRLAWKPVKGVELSLVGQNLLHDRQVEFQQQILNTKPAVVGRSMYGKVTWMF
ncbi:TonB-dependent siderophore receptor [Geobacter sp. FeAm09]|uniref:TonB-dependent receptor plug domain-containing protein n=1 Tax=Geobacter sp. FeAm09 TaxID=2597769 RepID=UPI00143CE0F0|nr:TonB-dependent receptor [Geobacter sp. FeAm09]